MNKKKLFSKSVIILKDLPSDYIEEAIIVVKEKQKNKIRYFDENIKNNNVIEDRIKIDEIKKIENIKKENRNYVIKEAQSILANYINRIEENFNYNKNRQIVKNNKLLKIINVILILAIMTLISFFIIKL